MRLDSTTGSYCQGLYTVLDCRVGSEPFAARLLHEVVQHWLQAAFEYAALSPGCQPEGAPAAAGEAKGGKRAAAAENAKLAAAQSVGSSVLMAALVIVRKSSVEEVLPWGRHLRQSFREALERVQASWVSLGDLDLPDRGSLLRFSNGEDALQAAVEGAMEALRVCSSGRAARGGLGLEVWTLRPNTVCRGLASSIAAPLLQQQQHQHEALAVPGRSIRKTVVALRKAGRAECGAAPSAERLLETSADESEEDSAAAAAAPGRVPFSGLPEGMEMVICEASRAGVLRYLRKHVTTSLLVNLRLPCGAMAQITKAKPRAFKQSAAEPGEPVVKMKCISPLLLPPGQQAKATACRPHVNSEFAFRGLVRADSVLPAAHLYGMPLVAQLTDDSGAVSLTARLQNVDGCTTLADCCKAFAKDMLKSGCLALFDAKVCPLTLATSNERRLFVAVPSAGAAGRFVLHGALCAEVSSARAPDGAQAEGSPPPPDAQQTEDELNFDQWPLQAMLNPLALRADRLCFHDCYTEGSERVPAARGAAVAATSIQVPPRPQAKPKGRAKRRRGEATAAQAAVGMPGPSAAMLAAVPMHPDMHGMTVPMTPMMPAQFHHHHHHPGMTIPMTPFAAQLTPAGMGMVIPQTPLPAQQQLPQTPLPMQFAGGMPIPRTPLPCHPLDAQAAGRPMAIPRTPLPATGAGAGTAVAASMDPHTSYGPHIPGTPLPPMPAGGPTATILRPPVPGILQAAATHMPADHSHHGMVLAGPPPQRARAPRGRTAPAEASAVSMMAAPVDTLPPQVGSSLASLACLLPPSKKPRGAAGPESVPAAR
eukprot:TRINITY_DN33330_c0_g4_i1.p1 TRINITY_DN33330_c0_g4~~TRINITY_DN33330_c0_g4_i1.p1  ORF type:complete len:821 (-),score=192.44 TRINITY_DN33330_c0_g4_i1:298-2760(-)